MSNKRKKNIIIILCVLELFLIASTLISFRNRDINQYIASVSELDTDMFAIMVENDDGTYSQTKESTFPNSDIYKFNNELSGCIDYSGNNVKDALTYDEINNKVTATVSGTSYCYLYFDSKFKFKGDTLAGHLINNPAKYNMWYSGLEGDGHRFIGENPNNYVCFGTSDKTECTSNPDNYMYRIIGVFDEGDKTYRVKLIKNSELSTSYQYNNVPNDDNWSETQLFKGLNNNYYYDTLGLEWQTYIDEWKWSAVNTLTNNSGIKYNKLATKGVYSHEMNRSDKLLKEGEWTTPSAKVGLMYVNDYMLSLGKEGLYYTSTDNSVELKTSWLTPVSNEWTMSKFGPLNSVSNGWTISNNGTISNSAVNSALKVRPTFYLSSYVKYESGTGTQTDPIMIYKPVAPKGKITIDQNNLTAIITKGDYELDSYCINMSSSTEDCNWTPVTTTTITKAVTELGFYYIHIIDKEGYIGHSDGVKFYSMAEILINKEVMWQSSLNGDGYRYTGSGAATAGTTPKNFVCFGTSDKATCTGNPNNYMYRIIGVFPDAKGTQYVKLIKYATVGKLAWNTNYNTDIVWEQSDLSKNLNGLTFLTNTTYVPNATWNNKIANWRWSAVNTKTNSASGMDYYSVTTAQMYLHEMNRSNKPSTIGAWTTPSAKIGLMYASDYQMSLGASSLNYKGNSNAATLKTGWMFVDNNSNTSGTSYEWTISRYGDYGGAYSTWVLYSTGNVGRDYVNNANAVRPTFYLESNVQLKSGSGTIADPYIIEE